MAGQWGRRGVVRQGGVGLFQGFIAMGSPAMKQPDGADDYCGFERNAERVWVQPR